LTYLVFLVICVRLDNPEKEEEIEPAQTRPYAAEEMHEIREKRKLWKEDEP
jgi:hypothetical protein